MPDSLYFQVEIQQYMCNMSDSEFDDFSDLLKSDIADDTLVQLVICPILYLILSQMTNFRLFQAERVCRQQS